MNHIIVFSNPDMVMTSLLHCLYVFNYTDACICLYLTFQRLLKYLYIYLIYHKIKSFHHEKLRVG